MNWHGRITLQNKMLFINPPPGGFFLSALINWRQIVKETTVHTLRKLLIASIISVGIAHAQEVELSALKDHPPQPVTEANWTKSAGNMRWISRNFSVKPSLILARGDQVFELPRELVDKAIVEGRSFKQPDSGLPVTLVEVFDQAAVDAYLVIHEEKIIYERYFNGFQPYTHHSWYSGAKSLIGMAAGILVEAGKLDTSKTPADYIPALKGSAYERVSVCLQLRSGCHDTGARSL